MEKLGIQNPASSTYVTYLIQKASQTLSQAQEQELKEFCDKNHLQVENPVYFDYMKFQSYIIQLQKCRDCKKIQDACSARKIYVESGRIKTSDIGCPVKNAKRIINFSGVPVKFINCRAEDFKISPYNVDSVSTASLSIHGRFSLYIYGDVGIGKTMLSSIIINERAYLGLRSLFYTVTDMLDNLRDFSDSNKRDEKLFKLKTCACLVIDDMGAENVTDWVSSTLFSILDYRYKNNLQTIINSNFDVDSLCKRYTAYHGERIGRRIRSMCKIIYIK